MEGDVVHDLDQETLPIHYTPMEITEDGGRDIIPAQDKLHQLKIKPEAHISYTEYRMDGYTIPKEVRMRLSVSTRNTGKILNSR